MNIGDDLHLLSLRCRQKSEQLIQRESRTSGELLLPVSRRPSHWEMISQRNNGAPARIPNRISPWWFTWQTVAKGKGDYHCNMRETLFTQEFKPTLNY